MTVTRKPRSLDDFYGDIASITGTGEEGRRQLESILRRHNAPPLGKAAASALITITGLVDGKFPVESSLQEWMAGTLPLPRKPAPPSRQGTEQRLDDTPLAERAKLSDAEWEARMDKQMAELDADPQPHTPGGFWLDITGPPDPDPDFVDPAWDNPPATEELAAGLRRMDEAEKSYWSRQGQKREEAEALAGGVVQGAEAILAAAERWRPLFLEELERLPLPEFLLDERYLVARNINLLAGQSASGKTYLALRWSLQLAAQGREVFYLLNEGADVLGPRTRAWMENYSVGERPPIHHYIHSFHLVENRTDIVQMVRDYAGRADLIVVDTLRRATAGLDENSSSDYSEVVASCDFIMEHTGAGILLVDHTGWDAKDRVRGTSSKQDSAYMVMELTRTKGSDLVMLKNSKLKSGKEFGSEQWQFRSVGNDAVLIPASEVPFAQRSDAEAKRRAEIYRATERRPFTAKDASVVWDCSKRDAEKKLMAAEWAVVLQESTGPKAAVWGIRGLTEGT